MKRKIIYAVTLLLGLSLFSFYAKAQNWQAYKGVWLKGYDNATQAPTPPTGYSALTYFADSLGTYVYDWDSLAWLRIPGSGGGGGGIVTADNGLTVSPAGNVKLGGTMLDNPTQISFDNNSTLEFLYPNGQGTIFSDNLFGTGISNGGSDYFITIDPTGSSGLGTGVTSGVANGATLELLPTSGTMRMGANSVLQYNANDITISKPTTGTLGGTLFMNNSIARLSAASASGIQSFQLGTGETATLGSSLGSTFTFNNASTATAIISTPATFRLDGGTGANTSLLSLGSSATMSTTQSTGTSSLTTTGNNATLTAAGPSGGTNSNSVAQVINHTTERISFTSAANGPGGGGGVLQIDIPNANQASIKTTTGSVFVGHDLNAASETIGLTSSQGSTVTFDLSSPLRSVINPSGKLSIAGITENTALTDSVLMVDGDGTIFWKTISGGGGGITNDANINELPVTSDASGNLTHTGIMHSLVGSAVSPDSVRLSVGDVDMWINNADNDISMGTTNSRLKFDFSNPAQPAIGVTEPFAGVNATLTLRTAGNGGFFIEKDNPGETYFTMSQAGTMTLGSNQVGGEFWTISAVNPTSDANLSLNAQEGIRLVAGNSFVQIGSAGGGTYTIGGGTNGILNGNGTNIVIQPGIENGSGTPGNITIDQLNGFLILSNVPTANPCGSAPAGTVWNNSGVLNICP